jgi:hypothetical protein
LDCIGLHLTGGFRIQSKRDEVNREPRQTGEDFLT